jgi:hypothetical protein
MTFRELPTRRPTFSKKVSKKSFAFNLLSLPSVASICRKLPTVIQLSSAPAGPPTISRPERKTSQRFSSQFLSRQPYCDLIKTKERHYSQPAKTKSSKHATIPPEYRLPRIHTISSLLRYRDKEERGPDRSSQRTYLQARYCMLSLLSRY